MNRYVDDTVDVDRDDTVVDDVVRDDRLMMFVNDDRLMMIYSR